MCYHSLTESSCFYRPCTLLSSQNLCVPWKHANLPKWLHWPKAIDYTPSRLECHWNTGSDQMLHPGSALVPLYSISPICPLPCFLLCGKWAPTVAAAFQRRNGPVCITSQVHFFFFPVGMQGVFFFHFSDNAIVRGRRKPLLRYPLFNNSPFFMFILWLSQQLLRSWALSSPTIHCRTALVWHSSPFFFFFPHSSVWAGQSRPKSWRQ